MTKKKKNARHQNASEEVNEINRLTSSIVKAIRFDDSDDACIVGDILQRFNLIVSEIYPVEICGLWYLAVDFKSEAGDALFVADPD